MKMLIPSCEYDYELNLNQITIIFSIVLKSLLLFGPGNMKPKVITKDVALADFPKNSSK